MKKTKRAMTGAERVRKYRALHRTSLRLPITTTSAVRGVMRSWSDDHVRYVLRLITAEAKRRGL